MLDTVISITPDNIYSLLESREAISNLPKEDKARIYELLNFK